MNDDTDYMLTALVVSTVVAVLYYFVQVVSEPEDDEDL